VCVIRNYIFIQTGFLGLYKNIYEYANKKSNYVTLIIFSKNIFENFFTPNIETNIVLTYCCKYFTQTNHPQVELEDSKLFVQILLVDMVLSQQHSPPTLAILFHRGAL
jgi:hypothetical protein